MAERIIGSSENNAKVRGFKVNFGVLAFFPQHLSVFFPYLLLVDMSGVKMRELHQADLLPLTQLKFLHVSDNEIEYVEHELFIFNQQLEVIAMARNRIVNIDADVFDDLKNLRYLNLEGNGCIKGAAEDKKFLKNFLSEVKEKCSNCDYRMQRNLTADLRHMRTTVEALKLENSALQAQNSRSLEIKANVTAELDGLKLKIAQKHSRNVNRVALLTIMLTVMCVLSVVFAVIIIWFILHIRAGRNVRCSQIIEYSKRNDEHIVMRQQQQQHRQRSVENVYEDINGNGRGSDLVYDKLDHF
jgi:hypothetical protein